MVRNCVIPRMETTFYDEAATYQHRLGDVNHLKRSLTLDFNAVRSASAVNAKRPRLNASVAAAVGVGGPPVLSSPDLNLLKLGSPELEKLIIAQQNGIVTATPTPSQILFPRTVTEEQELYARGFVDALNELHTSDSSQMSAGLDVPVTSGAGVTYTNLEPHGNGGGVLQQTTFPPLSSYGMVMSPPEVVIKDEPQTVPSLGSSPPLSPINMECQEKIKLERKRQRNRIAASKCRRRKLERISRLEEKVKQLKGENSELGSVVHKLKEQVCHLKEQVMDHVHSGCQIMVSPHF